MNNNTQYGSKLTPEEVLTMISASSLWSSKLRIINDYTAALQARVVELEEELEKHRQSTIENCKLRRDIESKQSRIAELERENESIKDTRDRTSRELFWQKQLNEKLMGLLEESYKAERWANYMHAGMNMNYIGEQVDSDWQSYCKEHGLNQNKKQENNDN